MKELMRELEDPSINRRGRASRRNSLAALTSFGNDELARILIESPEEEVDMDEDLRDTNYSLGKEFTREIPWKSFSEVEVQAIIKVHLDILGYSTSWRHVDDSSHERGIDIKARKGSQTVAVAVKKKPKLEDVGQLLQFSQSAADIRVYVYYDGASQGFLDSLQKLEGKVEVWDKGQLETELGRSNLIFQLVAENSPLVESIWKMRRVFYYYLYGPKPGPTQNPKLDANELRNRLWSMKDRAVTLNRCASLLQLILERGDRFKSLSYPELLYVFRAGLDYLYASSVKAIEDTVVVLPNELKQLLRTIHDADPARSNWLYLLGYSPSLRPGLITGTMKAHQDFEARHRETIEKLKKAQAGRNYLEIQPSYESAAKEFQRIMVWGDSLEDTIDILFRRIQKVE